MAKDKINEIEILARFEECVKNQGGIFEPTAISMSVGNIYNDISKGNILKADFQRNFRWDAEKQSRLIESLFLGYTPPCLFAYYEKDEHDINRLRFHDGLQRSFSIFQFIEGKLTLKGLEKLKFLNGFKFNELPVRLQYEITQRSVVVVKYPEGTPKSIIQEHFNRLNTTAEPLSMGETFRGTYFGKYYNIISSLGEFETFLTAMGSKGKGKLKDAREHEKYVMYWAAMCQNKMWTPRSVEIEYKSSPLTNEDYIDAHLKSWDEKEKKDENVITKELETNIRTSFQKAVNLCVKIFGSLPFRAPKIITVNTEDKVIRQFVMKDGEIEKNNTNNGMFECFMYLMTFADADSVEKHAKQIKSEFYNGLLAKPEVYETFRNTCMNGKSASTRFRFVYDLLTKCGVTFSNM
jgi:hypothetical protein